MDKKQLGPLIMFAGIGIGFRGSSLWEYGFSLCQRFQHRAKHRGLLPISCSCSYIRDRNLDTMGHEATQLGFAPRKEAVTHV
jgi:hypothetical protein